LIVEKDRFKTNEKISINVILSRYRKSDTTVTFNFKVPQNPCDLLFRVSGASEYIGYELGRAPLNFQFDYFDEWRAFLNSMPPPDELIVSVYKKESSLITDAGEIKNPPPSLRMVVGKGERKIYSDSYPLFEEKIKFDGPLSGESSSVLEVRR
jgi:hypothetical protein